MKNSKKVGVVVKSSVKAGAVRAPNHNAAKTSKKGIVVRTSVKAGGLDGANHNASKPTKSAKPPQHVRVRSNIKVGPIYIGYDMKGGR